MRRGLDVILSLGVFSHVKGLVVNIEDLESS